jgi:hypothetical protein
MAKRVQRRRGTTSEHSGFTGAEGEVTVDTTIDTLVVHDGATAGGFPLAKADGSNIANNSIGIIQLNVADGSAGWFLKTDGAGTLSFAAVDVGGTALGGSKLGGTIANATIDVGAVGISELAVSEAGSGGSAGHFLKTDGAGTLSFAAVVTDPTMGGDIGGITSVNYINTGKINPAHLSTPLKDFTVDDGVGSLGVDTFALSAAPGSVNAIIVYIDGIVQPPTAYSLSSSPNQIVFVTDPPVGSIIRIVHLGFQSTVGTPSDGSITAQKLAANAVTTDKILPLTITTGDLADDLITEAKIAAQTITEASITPNTITNISIANATVTGTQIADNAINGEKISIAGNAQGDIMYYDGTNWVRLAAGTTSHVLTTTGTGANPYWAAGSSGTALPGVGSSGNVLTSDGSNWASEVVPVATTTVSGSVEIATQAEVNAGTDTTRSITPATLFSASSSVPAGVLNPYAGATAPTGWLLCYGQSILRATYATLFTAIGTTYGSVSGTTFNLPDMRGRAVAGQDDMGGSGAGRVTTAGSGIAGDTLGAVGGTESHRHNRNANANNQYQGGSDMDNASSMQPTIILNYIIKI